MVKSSKGIRRRTRSKFRKHPRDKGMSPLTRTIQTFDVGEKASVVIDPSVHRGQPHNRFQGQTGTVIGNQGKAYLIQIKDQNKPKKLLVKPDHLKKVKS